jgi:hypothetical protein
MQIAKKTLSNSCVFACLESFLSDNGIPKSQDKMIKEIVSKKPGLCSLDGIVPIDKICEVCNELGIDCKKIDYNFPIIDTYDNEKALLMLVTKNGNHCIRYKENCSDNKNKILVMDPEHFEKIKEWEFVYYEEGKDFDNNTCEFYELKLKRNKMDQLDKYIKNTKKSLFRFEGLQDYSGEDGDEIVKMFIDTNMLAQLPNNDSWWNEMKKKNEQGIITQRVRLIIEPLTDYTKMELAYLKQAKNYSGDDIKIIEEKDFKQIAPNELSDFWMIDDTYVFEMEYGPKGKYFGSSMDDKKIMEYVNIKKKLLEVSKPI